MKPLAGRPSDDADSEGLTCCITHDLMGTRPRYGHLNRLIRGVARALSGPDDYSRRFRSINKTVPTDEEAAVGIRRCALGDCDELN